MDHNKRPHFFFPPNKMREYASHVHMVESAQNGRTPPCVFKKINKREREKLGDEYASRAYTSKNELLKNIIPSLDTTFF